MSTNAPQSTTAPLFAIRALAPTDMPFVFNSFLKSYRDSPTTSGIPNGLYYAAQHLIIERCVADPAAVALAAVSTAESDQIYGYALGARHDNAAVLHWSYTKHPFRGFGIAKTLMAAIVGEKPDIAVYFTHRMRNIGQLLKNKQSYIYNPYLLMDGAK